MIKKKFLLRITLICLLLSVLVVLLVFFPSSKKSGESVEVTVEIIPGTSVREISELLGENKVISFPYLFYIMTIIKDIDKDIMAGVYVLKTNSTYEEVFESITTEPDVRIYKLIIPEGFTIKQIYERLEEIEITDERRFYELANDSYQFASEYDFLKFNPLPILEGYLFPKTYYFKDNPEPEDIMDVLLKQFQKEIIVFKDKIDENSEYNLHQLITIASLIEKEAKIPEEREIISGVIYNRLERNMPLQIDASVQYGMGRIKKLSDSDLEYPSPYNTYLHKGLPPGPICNPGTDSINAAINPKDVDYLYYVLFDKEGHHKFTVTYEEFMEAKKEAKRRKVY